MYPATVSAGTATIRLGTALRPENFEKKPTTANPSQGAISHSLCFVFLQNTRTSHDSTPIQKKDELPRHKLQVAYKPQSTPRKERNKPVCSPRVTRRKKTDKTNINTKSYPGRIHKAGFKERIINSLARTNSDDDRSKMHQHSLGKACHLPFNRIKKSFFKFTLKHNSFFRYRPLFLKILQPLKVGNWRLNIFSARRSHRRFRKGWRS